MILQTRLFEYLGITPAQLWYLRKNDPDFPKRYGERRGYCYKKTDCDAYKNNANAEYLKSIGCIKGLNAKVDNTPVLKEWLKTTVNRDPTKLTRPVPPTGWNPYRTITEDSGGWT